MCDSNIALWVTFSDRLTWTVTHDLSEKEILNLSMLTNLIFLLSIEHVSLGTSNSVTFTLEHSRACMMDTLGFIYRLFSY